MIEMEKVRNFEDVYEIAKEFIEKNCIQYAFYFPSNFKEALLRKNISYIQEKNYWTIRLSQIYQMENFLFTDDINTDISLLISNESKEIIGLINESLPQTFVAKESFCLYNKKLLYSMFKFTGGVPTYKYGWANIFKNHLHQFELCGINMREIQTTIEYKLKFQNQFSEEVNNRYDFKVDSQGKEYHLSIQKANSGIVLGSYPFLMAEEISDKPVKILLSLEYKQQPIWLLNKENIIIHDANFYKNLSIQTKESIKNLQYIYDTLFIDDMLKFTYTGFKREIDEINFKIFFSNVATQLEIEFGRTYKIIYTDRL